LSVIVSFRHCETRRVEAIFCCHCEFRKGRINLMPQASPRGGFAAVGSHPFSFSGGLLRAYALAMTLYVGKASEAQESPPTVFFFRHRAMKPCRHRFAPVIGR
jgi:hypothetical protein